MPVRPLIRRFATLSAAVALTGTVTALALASPAFATGPTAGSEVAGSALPIGTATPGPFASGQIIQIQIPANSTLTPGAGINIVECAAPGGVAPTNPAACDGNTIEQMIFAGTNGSVSYTNVAPDHGYTVYALPDANLGESSTGTPVCNLTNEGACSSSVRTRTTSPSRTSSPSPSCPARGGRRRTPAGTGTAPGTATPEAPFAIGLPLIAMGVLGGALFLRRRRHAGASSTP